MTEVSADELVRSVGATGLLAGAEPVLLMCSAGRDSHCLLDVAVRLRGAAGVRVLHVDHGLRENSPADADQMRERCEALGVGFVARSAGARPLDAEGDPTGNLHAWAREARARLAAQERERVGARVIATAHTRTDLVETALMRLAMQPGRRALLSMRAVEPIGDGSGEALGVGADEAPLLGARDVSGPGPGPGPGPGLLVRPLLGISRDATGAYCRARGITWRDDPSNADPKYARARLRHSVVPVLRSLNPHAEDAIARTLAELAEESVVLDALVEVELLSVGATPDAALGAGPAAAPGAGAPHIALERLAALPAALARLVLRELCERSLGHGVPRAGARLEEVLALGPAAARSGAAALDVGAGARIELRGGTLRCIPSAGPAAPRG